MQSFTPSLQASTQPAQLTGGSISGSFAELAAFIKQEVATPQAAADVVSEEQLRALGARLQALHEAQLLSQEQLYEMEDAVADAAEILPSAAAGDSAVEKVLRMLRLAASIETDAAFARQLRRKFSRGS